MDSYFYAVVKMAILLIIAALSAWLVEISSPPVIKSERPIRHEHDLFASNLAASIFNAQGLLQHQIRSDFLEHFVDDDSTELNAPHFILFQDGQPAWLISAQRGRVTSKGETVLLENLVRISRPVNFPPGELTTQKLLVLPKTQYAETDQPVVIDYLRHQATAIGMQIYLTEKRLELLHQVRVQFHPAESPHGN